MPSTTRTPFPDATPDRISSGNGIPLSPLVSYIPAPQFPLRSGNAPRLTHLWAGTVQSLKTTVQSNVGMLLVAGSQLFFSLMNVWVKKLNSLDPPVPAFELIFVRMGITWICCITYMLIAKVPDPILGPKGVRLLLAARGFFGFFGLFGVYYSLQYLSLSDATVLTFLAPMCTAITGAVLLHEPFSWREAVAGLTSLLGVVLIARPAFLFGQHHHPNPVMDIDIGDIVEPTHGEADGAMIATPAQRVAAVGVALLGVLGSTGAYTTIRAIGKRAHPLHNLVSFSSQCVIVATVGMLAMRTPIVVPTRWDWLVMLVLIGIFGFIAQVLLTMGLQREAAGRGTMAIYIQIVFATIFERVVFHTSPSFLSVIGTLIILTSAIYVALTKARTEDKPARPKGMTASDDPSVEEGLLAHQAEEYLGDTKDIELNTISVVPSMSDGYHKDIDSEQLLERDTGVSKALPY